MNTPPAAALYHGGPRVPWFGLTRKFAVAAAQTSCRILIAQEYYFESVDYAPEDRRMNTTTFEIEPGAAAPGAQACAPGGRS